MPETPRYNHTLVVNGKTFEHVEADVTIETDMSDIWAVPRPKTFKIKVKTNQISRVFIEPQIVDLADIDPYLQQCLTDRVYILGRLVPRLVSDGVAWITGDDDYKESPSFQNLKKVVLTLKYKGHTIECGPVHKLIWMDIEELSELLADRVKEIKEKITRLELEQARIKEEAEKRRLALAQKAREADPLYVWGKRMTSLGYHGSWKIEHANLTAPAGVNTGDMMLFVRFEKLTREDKYVFIGVLHELVTLSDSDLRLAISNAYQKASGSYEYPTGIHGYYSIWTTK